MRHIALRYVEHGFVAVAVRMPGHGTVPAGLTTTRWEAWVGGDAARGAHGAHDGRRQSAVAHGRLFERRRAGAEICARLACRSETGAARSAGAALAHGRHHELCAFRRRARLAGRLSVVRQGGVARRAAGIQPVQVQLVSGECRAAEFAGGARRGGGVRQRRGKRRARQTTAGAHVPVGARCHGLDQRRGRIRCTATCRQMAASWCCSIAITAPAWGR